MREIIAAILYNFRNLFRVTGRDPRAQFWPYAIFLFIVQSIISVILMIPVLFRIVSIPFEFIRQHPPKAGQPLNPADVKEFTQKMMQEVFSEMRSVLTTVTPILTVIFVILIAAAVARRLHDRDKSGYWGLMPLPFTAFGLATMPMFFSAILAQGYDDSKLLGIGGSLGIAVSLNNLLYWAAVIWLIVLLARQGSPGPNRYGPRR
jgi:uncharacterized membrane protein YhaH (DUF805 family)